MKKSILVLIICLFTLVITGCSSKEAKSSSEVLSILNRYNYSVHDNTSKFEFADASYYVAEPFVLNYVKSGDKNKIKGIFLDECQNIQNSIGTNINRKFKTSDKYVFYSEEDETHYYYAAYLDGSYVTIIGELSMKDDIDFLAKELGF